MAPSFAAIRANRQTVALVFELTLREEAIIRVEPGRPTSFRFITSMVFMAGLLNLKGVVLAGLMQAQKLIRVNDDPRGIGAQFRIMTPRGDFLIAMTLSEDPRERIGLLRQVSNFMAWKTAWVFTVAGELLDPDAVYCFGATREDRIAAISTIERDPVCFSNPEWLATEQVDEEILALLPRDGLVFDDAAVAELDGYFGAHGKFPATRLGGGVPQAGLARKNEPLP